MTAPDATDRARAAIQSLLDGDAPNGAQPDAYGPWASVISALHAAHATGGAAQVRRTFDALSRAHRDLIRLLASDAPRRPPSAASDMPPLPAAVLVPEVAGATPWLDEYIAYSRRWSPRSFDDFHESVAIWLLSAIAARRVVAHVGKPRYTPLLIALVARSGLYAKTTAAELGIDLLRAAGLDWMVTADSVTPQRFIADRTQRLPEDYDSLNPTEQAQARLQLAFAGQRGWWYDEFGMLVGSMSRSGSVMHEFSGLLRRFDECDPVYRHGTVGRGKDEIVQPYVSLLAALTPADLRSVMRRGSTGWTNGLWPRWAFVCPPDGNYRVDRFPTGERRAPGNLVRRLREWHDDLRTPHCDISNGGHGWICQIAPVVPTTLTVAPGVIDAYYTYSAALLELIAGSATAELDSWYARLHDRVLRVALLLASVEGADQVELAHWARAQAIGERWRASLYRLYQQVNNQQEATQKATAEDAVLEIIQRMGNPTARDIKTRITWLSRAEIQEVCTHLVSAGTIQATPTSHSIRYSLPYDPETEDEEVKI